VLEWLQLPAERRPHVLTLYFNDLDSAAHAGTLDSPGIEAAATSVDRSLGALLDGIDALDIRDRIYLLLTSDHGMVETSADRTISLDSLINTSALEASFGGAVANLHVTGGADKARQIRDAINGKLQQGRAYLREELPARHQYRRNPRAGDVVVIMNESWTLATSPRRSPRSGGVWGAHGWDPALPSMRAIFMAAGPRVRAGATIDEVRNVDVYPLMTELLGLRPAAGIDGVPGRIRSQLDARTSSARPTYDVVVR
jgi:predicted AlkP superfamily pyrophosphatase or phosphodiesterase